MNVIALLEYELAYYDSAVHRFNHYTTRTTPFNLGTKTNLTLPSAHILSFCYFGGQFNLGNLTHFVLVSVCLHFALLDSRVLTSLEEVCITWVAAVNSFAKLLNPRKGSVYTVIHRQTVLSYRKSTVWQNTLDSSSWDRNPPNFMLDMIPNRSGILICVNLGIITHTY